jgi:uncharacterized protein (DUF302 family)
MKTSLLLLLLLSATLAAADPVGVLRFTSDRPLGQVYDKIHSALEEEKFWVVFEADMGDRMARFADKWGEDYNRSGVGAVKSMVFCNIWWTNRIANADPDLLALCPLHLSLYEKDGKTVVIMPKLSTMAEGSAGLDEAAKLEAELAAILGRALAVE